jgi:hypothetical protein
MYPLVSALTSSTTRSVYLLSLDTTVSVPPLELFNTTPSQAVNFLWLSTQTVGYLNGSALYSVPINYTTSQAFASVKTSHVLDFPLGVNPTDLQFELESGVLGFSGQVWEDGEFEKVGEHDAKWAARGTSGMVYDELFIR